MVGQFGQGGGAERETLKNVERARHESRSTAEFVCRGQHRANYHQVGIAEMVRLGNR